MIVVYTWVRMRTIIGHLDKQHPWHPGRRRRDFSEEISYLHREALAITESVLYVKQHSVNCVPAALFALHDLLEEFSLEIGDQFVDALFASGTLDPKCRTGIGAHMKQLHRRFLAEKNAGHAPTAIIVEFLRTRGNAMDLPGCEEMESPPLPVPTPCHPRSSGEHPAC
jgi:hypothetical protein